MTTALAAAGGAAFLISAGGVALVFGSAGLTPAALLALCGGSLTAWSVYDVDQGDPRLFLNAKN